MRKRDDGPVHLTEEGLRRMKENLARLKRALPELIAETQRAAAYGDRSENAEYKLAKGSLRHANWQILKLQDQINRATVIKSGADADGLIQIGSTVITESDGVKKIFEIVGSRETNPAKGRISFASPIGDALMRRRAGETVIVKTPTGPREYRILEVK